MAVTNAGSAEQFCLEVFSVKLHGELIFLAVVKMKVKSDHRSKFSSLSNWKEEA